MVPHEPGTRRSRRCFLRTSALVGTALGTLGSDRVAAADVPSAPGASVSPYGTRSRFEQARRLPGSSRTPQATVSYTPLADLYGTLTPSSLHFERHHAGVPDLDPSTHTLTIHGLVDRPLVFSLDELKRLPSVTRIVFIECSGNTSSEWTGVSLSTLLHECAIQPRASWLLAEGRDAARVARSLPIEKA